MALCGAYPQRHPERTAFYFALFFGAIFSGSGGASRMSVAIVDEDGSDVSRAFVEKLRPPPIRVGLDAARRAEARYLEGLLTQTAMESAFSDPEVMRRSIRKQREDLRDAPTADREQLEKFFDDLDRMMGSMESVGAPGSSVAPARIVTEPAGPARVTPSSSWEITFPSAILWGLLGCAAGFAISMVQERTAGALRRLRIAPVTRGQLLAGKGLACFLACVAVAILLLTFGALVFRVRVGSVPVLAAAVLSRAVCFVGIMMFLSVLGRTENSVAGAGWAILMVMAMLGGGMVPLFVMPSWMQKVSHVSPVKWGILSIEGAVWRGFTQGSWSQFATSLPRNDRAAMMP